MPDYGVEFLDEPSDPSFQSEPPQPPGSAERTDRLRAAPAYVAGALWLTAALLAYLSPGHALYRWSVVNLAQDFPLRVTSGWDGWGDPFGQATGDRARFGYALWTAALVLLAVGVGTLWSTVRPLPAAPLRAAAWAAPALTAGIVLTLGLGVRGSMPDRFAFTFAGAPPDVLDRLPGVSVSPTLTVDGPSFGPSFWLALAAAIAAVLAALVQLAGPAVTGRFVTNRTGRRRPD